MPRARFLVWRQTRLPGHCREKRGVWRSAWPPVVSFAWLTAVLFNAGQIQHYRWSMFALTIALANIVLAAGGWTQLMRGGQKLPLIALFFLGESLVWGTYGAYMDTGLPRRRLCLPRRRSQLLSTTWGSYTYGRERTGDRWLGIRGLF